MNSDANPIDLLFGDLAKLGPGDNVSTLSVLHRLPSQNFEVIVDAGCGTGRQSLVLAHELGTPVHAVDSYAPFLHQLTQRARAAGIEQLIHTHCMDMKNIPEAFPHIDLLWSEGAAYNIGFDNALSVWACAINEKGFAVVSELSWLGGQVPASVREFFLSGYPDMRSVSDNLAVAQRAGYNVLDTHTLPAESWVDGYYDILEPRAQALLDHPQASVREFAAETIKEIAVFNVSEGSYGYVFYLLQRA